ncbi:MAG: dihydrolipoyl dehydrogenase [Candidatus Altiarchaeota archaeon]
MEQQKMKYDAVIIGGGPGGYTAAIRTAQLGGKAILVERDALGGVCTNRGCIPTKTLWSVARDMGRMDSLAKRGVLVEKSGIDFNALLKWKNRVVSTTVKGIEKLLESNSIEVVYGNARILDVKTVEADGRRLECDNIIIATGSVPAGIPGIEYDGEFILSSEGILGLEELPARLLIIGGGVVGVEYATIFSRLGSEVTIVEMEERLLPMEDPEISGEVMKNLSKNAKIHVNSKVSRTDSTSGKAYVETPDGSIEVNADKVLVAVGRIPSINRQELDALGIEYDNRGIKVDSRMRTNITGIYAIGDVAGGLQLAHVASNEGLVAAENMMGIDSEMTYDAIPWCVFSIPEMARVGVTSHEAGEHGEGMFPYAASGKARCEDARQGFAKVLIDSNHRIIGVHLVGENASDMIAEAALAVDRRMTAEEFAETVRAHPTYPEIILEAVLDAINSAIHLPKD